MSSPTGIKPVFFDRAGKRWPRARRLVVLLSLAGFIGTVLFVQSLLVAPTLMLPLKVKKLKDQLRYLQKQSPPAPNMAAANQIALDAFFHSPRGLKQKDNLLKQAAAKPSRPARARDIRLGFYVNWDPASFASLTAHVDKLTHVCPDWFSLTTSDGNFTGETDTQLLQFLNENKGLTLLPILANVSGDTRTPEAVENLARASDSVQNLFLENLKLRLGDIHAGGVLVDWQGIDPAREEELTDLLVKMADGLHEVGLQLWLQVPAGDEQQVFDLGTLADSVDFFVAALHDEASEEDPPNAIAAQNWFKGWLDTVASHADPQQWVIGLGNYGYDWPANPAAANRSGWARADTISFADAMSRAAYAGEGSTDSGAPDYNPSFDYTLAGVNHEVWFLDAITFLNQARAARAKGFNGLALTRLGTEDPLVWTAVDLLAAPQLSKADLAGLSYLKSGETITNIGEGEIITADISPESGNRQITLDEQTGLLSTEYQKFPQYPSIYHQGAGGPHQVALTFDDGPDPTWTPKILDILREKQVLATFFILGQQAENYPALVRRIVAEGHEFGSHTYTHTNLSLAGEQRTRLELDATQRLLQTITGRSTTLFRPPYEADARPGQLSEVTPLVVAQDLGYLTVMESIDPEDWSRPGADAILQRVKEQRHNGSIILLHDAGGDRSQTVEALPKIIDYLRARGDQIVPVCQLLGTTRDDLNELLKPKDRSLAQVASYVGFRALHTAFGFLWAFMIVATALIVLRTLLVIWLALGQRRRERAREQAAATAVVQSGQAVPLSVIIAAYNEEKVIAATLRSVLDTDYEGEVEVVVINDGSKDRTGEVVRELTQADGRLRLVEQENAGKSEALQRGVEFARHNLLVFLDADTLFQRDTLRYLAAAFVDPQVGAVSGHARVGNTGRFMAKCQALEYICGFNLDRRAYDAWNCITVAPGAISAVSREALRAVGGFRPDTLAEDTDLTLSLHRRGYLVRYESAAIAWTEAPETIRTLAKQRFRWCFGTMQCLWKHRDMLFNPKFGALGFFSLPSVWFFQIVLVALTPLVDLMLVVSIFLGSGGAVLPYLVTFLLLDQLLAVLACVLEKEPLKRSWIMVPMRLIYRPLLSWVVWKSIVSAARGVLVGWGKLERTASVTLPTRA